MQCSQLLLMDPSTTSTLTETGVSLGTTSSCNTTEVVNVATRAASTLSMHAGEPKVTTYNDCIYVIVKSCIKGTQAGLIWCVSLWNHISNGQSCMMVTAKTKKGPVPTKLSVVGIELPRYTILTRNRAEGNARCTSTPSNAATAPPREWPVSTSS